MNKIIEFFMKIYKHYGYLIHNYNGLMTRLPIIVIMCHLYYLQNKFDTKDNLFRYQIRINSSIINISYLEIPTRIPS